MTDCPELHLLDPRLVLWIKNQRWNGLRDIQRDAVRPILEGGTDVIVSASTAAGKTEAAFLPALTRLASQPAEGCGIVCLSPLKALINDQARRLQALCQPLGIPVTPWHGDIPWSQKQDFFAKPSGVLLVTPESLETFLMRHNGWCHEAFAGLACIVVDEFHAFVGGERGWQLASLLRRIDAMLHRKVPRIALSATLGSLEESAEMLRPNRQGYPCRLLEEGGARTSPLIQVRGYQFRFFTKNGKLCTTNDRLVEDLFRYLEGGNHLVFANSRTRTERLASDLAKLCEERGLENEFFPHHGSLSRELRHRLELRLQDPDKPTTAVCTMTLELGIDIGSVDSIAQVAAPSSVSSLRQRLGRSGRRSGQPVLRLFIMENGRTRKETLWDRLRLDLFQSLAMLRLLERKWYEPLADRRAHYSTLVQQILSLLAQYGAARPSQLHHLLCQTGPFPVEGQDFVELLKGLARLDLLHSGADHALVLTEQGLALTQDAGFTVAFRTPEDYALATEDQVIGRLPMTDPLEPGQRILFAGKSWKVSEVDDRRRCILLEPAADGAPPKFAGQSAEVHGHVRQEMFALYCSSEEPRVCDAGALALFREGREAFWEFDLEHKAIVRDEGRSFILPWLGDKTARTIAALLRLEGFEADDYNGIIDVKDATPAQLQRTMHAVVSRPRPDDGRLVRALPEPLFEKYDHLVAERLRDSDTALHFYDMDGAWTWMQAHAGKAKA